MIDYIKAYLYTDVSSIYFDILLHMKVK